jgi:hypothetical protein
MPSLVKPLAVSAAAVGLAGWLGATSTNTRPLAVPVAALDRVESSGTDDPRPAAGPLSDTVPVSTPVKYAVPPKPLSDPVKKGLAYLAKGQQDDGGWNQGGGWRTQLDGRGGRIEGAKVEDPSDVGNTCYALLAFIRAGSTPTEGEYAANIRKGLAFVLEKVEKADSDSLYVTDVRNTQLQSKIGPYVDTFLANLVLAELKGKGGEQDQRLAAALDKTVAKIVKHQGKDGQFAGNGGWAPVLSQGLANQALTRSKMAGAKVADEALGRVVAQSEVALAGKPAAAPAGPAAAPAGKPTAAAGEAVAAASPDRSSFERFGSGGIGGGGFGGGGIGGAPADAGVSLYRISQGARGGQDVANALKIDAEKAKKITADAKASKEAKEAARKTIEDYDKLTESNAKAQAALADQIKSDRFVRGFGSNGGEEFLSFMNISETLVVKGGKDWQDWDGKMQEMIPRAQDKDGSWSGHHCITGKTFCTAGALLVLMADRTPVPAETKNPPEKAEPKGGK